MKLRIKIFLFKIRYYKYCIKEAKIVSAYLKEYYKYIIFNNNKNNKICKNIQNRLIEHLENIIIDIKDDNI